MTGPLSRHIKRKTGLPSRLAPALERAGLLTGAPDWQPLSGGRTNHVWRIAQPDGDVVCKLSPRNAGPPLFPNVPTAEAVALYSLAGSGLAPRPLGRLTADEGPCLVYRHVPGEPWSGGAAAPVAVALARLHRRHPPAGLRRVGATAADLRDMADAILETLPPEPRLTALRPDLPHDPPGGPQAFLHGDPVPANIIAAETGAVLIDWQSAACGDPVHDLALFLSPGLQTVYLGAPLPGAEVAAFRTAYGDAAALERLDRRAPLHAYLVAAHCHWRVVNGDAGYAAGLEAELARLERGG
ncbi:phosphotransferase family protein [Tranquillimonas rosea]|uniref:phosphotransferase family protein n=1 Tax=Tranquillimonas rosea TaxID=641238 RepID=UPI003BAA5AF6